MLMYEQVRNTVRLDFFLTVSSLIQNEENNTNLYFIGINFQGKKTVIN